MPHLWSFLKQNINEPITECFWFHPAPNNCEIILEDYVSDTTLMMLYLGNETLADIRLNHKINIKIELSNK